MKIIILNELRKSFWKPNKLLFSYFRPAKLSDNVKGNTFSVTLIKNNFPNGQFKY